MHIGDAGLFARASILPVYHAARAHKPRQTTPPPSPKAESETRGELADLPTTQRGGVSNTLVSSSPKPATEGKAMGKAISERQGG